jgi:hypothetical protein
MIFDEALQNTTILSADPNFSEQPSAYSLPPLRKLLLVGALPLLSALLAACNTNPSSTNTNTSQTVQQSSPQLALWTDTLDGIQITMVGTDPSIPGAGTTKIPVEIIPITLNFSAAGTVISAEGPACGDTETIVNRVVNSPLFTNNNWSDPTGTIQVGNTQFADAFQRMNFWQFVSTASPNYHVLLQPVTVAPAITVDVPPGVGATLTPSPTCPSQLIGAIPSTLMDSAVESTISNQNITPNTLPIFLTYDISFVPQNFLGYHSVQGKQAYIVASYIDIGFTDPTVAASDVAVLSHEIGEWMNNPMLVNVVPPWGGYGIQTSCDTHLEVGDPLSRNIFPTQVGNFTYHEQELAFASWFTGPYASVAIDGLYSAGGSFTIPAPPCQ